MYGHMISSLRKKHKLSQKELGDNLGIGVSTISMWEAGKREPDYKYLMSIAELFGVSVDYLLYGKTDDKKLSQKERAVVDLFNQLSTEMQHEVLGIMKGILLGEK